MVDAELIFNNVSTLPNISSAVATLTEAVASSTFNLSVNTSSISAKGRSSCNLLFHPSWSFIVINCDFGCWSQIYDNKEIVTRLCNDLFNIVISSCDNSTNRTNHNIIFNNESKYHTRYYHEITMNFYMWLSQACNTIIQPHSYNHFIQPHHHSTSPLC